MSGEYFDNVIATRERAFVRNLGVKNVTHKIIIFVQKHLRLEFYLQILKKQSFLVYLYWQLTNQDKMISLSVRMSQTT